MKIRLLAFASASDALGTGETEMELPDGADVARLRALLEERHPELGPLWGRLAVAVDGEIAGPGTPLTEGVEVALLPPVSGGAPSLASRRAALTDGPIDAAAVAAAVSAPSRGAVLLFLGTVRGCRGERPVVGLTYSAYRPMAEERLARIVEELEAGGDDLRIAIVHRLGDVPVGEASVAIAAASPHRAAAYEASRLALERLKREVPVWKRERYGDGGEEWREEEALAAPPAGGARGR
jgi:molybdopterin synthase catalytic subunit